MIYLPGKNRDGTRKRSNENSVLSRLPALKGLLNPLIQTHAAGLRPCDNLGMQSGRNANHEFPGKMLLRLSAIFPAHIQEHLEGSASLSFEPFNVGRVKVSAAIQSNEFAPEHGDFRIISDDGLNRVDFQLVSHGVTPLASNHFRILSTAPLWVCGEGCGL